MSLPPIPPAVPPRLATLAIAVAALALVGCGMLRPDPPRPTRFYVLTSGADPAPVAADSHMAIGIGPVSLPPYLNRPEMVVRVADNQLVFDEYNRWGEPLKDNFVRVLASELDRTVGFDRMVFYPWYSNTPIDCTLAVAVLRFEPQPNGDVALDSRWTIRDSRGQVLANRDSHYVRPGGTPEERAAAMSALTGDLAGEIAVALRSVNTRK